MDAVELISRADLEILAQHRNGTPFHGTPRCRQRLQQNNLVWSKDGGQTWDITSDGAITLAEVGLR